MSVISSDVLASTPAQNYGDLLRSVPGVNVVQLSARDVNVTNRQATTDAQQHAARAARRPLHLPRLLRPRAVGLRAVEPERHQADRGGPRSGVGGLGRQRADRRRQHHHEIAARERSGRRPCSPPAASAAMPDRRQARAPAGCYGGNATFAQAPNERWSYRVLGRLLQLGSAAPSDRHDSGDSRSARPRTNRRRRHVSGGRHRADRRRVRQRRHQPAEVRRARRSGDRRRVA